MAIIPWLYEQAAKGFRNEPARKMKDILRPVKHALVGKQGIYKAIELAGDFERKKGREIMTVFDVGASIGEAVLPMARAFPHAKIYCFEPIPESFKRLQKRTTRFKKRIKYSNFGLYNKNGEVKFYVRADHSDASSIINPHNMENHREISIPTRRLDDVCKELGVKKIDFMKIDVEGIEKEVLEGAPEMLKNTNNVFVEISPERKNYNHDYIDVFEKLHAAGLSFLGVYGDYFFTRLLDYPSAQLPR